MINNLYNYLFKILKHLKHNDKIIIKSDCFTKKYDNVYQLLDMLHFAPDVKDFYKDYIVDDYSTVCVGRDINTGRSIYIYIHK